MADLSINEFLALLTVLLTSVITIANILMWRSAHRTIQLQTATNYSLNYQSLIQGHRDLLFGLMNQPTVLRGFAKVNKFDAEEWELQTISTLFINHAWVYYANFEHGTLDQIYLENFRKDAQDMFSWPSIAQCWQKTRTLYPATFQRFVDEELLTIAVGKDCKRP